MSCSPATRDCWLTLDRDALLHNLSVLRQCMPDSRVLAMVKADAYGHGVAPVAHWLAEAADGLGVACLQEALDLRARGIRGPVAVMEGVFNDDELRQACAAELQLVVHSNHQVALLQSAAADGQWQGQAVMVWLKVNTGMNRLGLRPAEALRAFLALQALPMVSRVGLMTHFACADELVSEMTDAQIARFRALQETLARAQGAPVEDSLANSAAVLAWPEARGRWMRPGLALYGSSPFAEHTAAAFDLRPVMTLQARVIAVFDVPAGETVGYGATWTAPAPTRVAVVSAGYGDGYPRHARSGTPVLINGQRCHLVGRVSMDMITVAVDQVPVAVGDAVVLWGAGLPVDEVAAHAGTLAYELFCRLTPRVRRASLA